MSRDNATWIANLSADDQSRETALADLHAILLRMLPNALSRWLDPDSSHFESLLEDIVQETLIRVIDRLETFQGRSKFTTWVYKIAINLALSQLRLRKWKEISLDGLVEGSDPNQKPSKIFTSPTPRPETILERKDAIALVQQIIAEELTPRQRKVMTAIHLQGVPLDVVAQRTNSNRNAIYKLMHDARLKLKRRLEREGMPPDELLSIFNQE